MYVSTKKETTMPADLVLASAFSVVGYEVFFGAKWQIFELVRTGGVVSSTPTEQQEERGD